MAAVLVPSGFRSPRRPVFGTSRSRIATIAAVVVFHLAVVAVLMQHEPARRTLKSMAPIIVSLIAEEPKPAPPPKVQPQKAKARRAAAPVDPVVAPPPVVTSAAPVESPITPMPVLPEAPPTAEPLDAVAAIAPAPIVPPRFDAEYLRNPAPGYPALSRRMHEQGRVMLRVLVNVDGIAERIELKTSSGSVRLDQSALETVRQWKFVPARQGDRTIAAWVVVPIMFTLDG